MHSIIFILIRIISRTTSVISILYYFMFLFDGKTVNSMIALAVFLIAVAITHTLNNRKE